MKSPTTLRSMMNQIADNCAILAMRIEYEEPKHLGARLLVRQVDKIVDAAGEYGILTDELVAWVQADVAFILAHPHSTVGRIRLRNTLGAIFFHCRYSYLS